MKNQFTYSEVITIPPTEKGGEATKETRINSFNVELAIRSIQLDDGGRLVLLDDLHERMQEKRSLNKNGKPITVKERDTFQSEIFLNKEDGERYLELTKL